MNASEQLIKRLLTWGLGLCIVLPGMVLGGTAVADHVRAYLVCRRYAEMTSKQRVDRLHRVGYRRDFRLAGLVREVLESTEKLDELQAAAYAAMRLGDSDLLPLLQRRADELPDTPTQAMLIAYTARLSNRDTRLTAWFEDGVESGEPWRRVGSSAGLLHLGRTEAGPLLVAAARDENSDIAAFAWRELAWATGPMAVAIGRPLAELDAKNPPLDAEAIERVDRFWQDHVTVTLLNDVLRRLTIRDSDWVEMGRLIHARDRVAKLMQ